MTIDNVRIRHAREADLPRINEIYNYYVIKTPITFDLVPLRSEQRRAWFKQFSENGRHQLFVAEDQGNVIGYADSHAFQQKRAYDTTVETTAYCAHDETGRGLGTQLYAMIFEALAAQDLRTAIAVITLPNDASVALHETFGFTLSGVMHDVGRKFDRYWDVAWYEKRLG